MTSWTCLDTVGLGSLLLPIIPLTFFLYRFKKASQTLTAQGCCPNLVYQKLHALRPTPDQSLLISAGVSAAWSIAFVLYWGKYHGNANYSTLWPGLHVVFWSVVPPVFFFYQWKSIYLCICKGDEYESFKMGQDLATKMWAAIALVLGAIYKFGS
jgi:hypothetical protein